MGSRLMMAHVPKGFFAALGVLSNAHGSALLRTYAAAVTQPSGNTATPSWSPPAVASPEYSMEEPAMWRTPLTKNPQLHAVKIHGREIVACDIAPIPPTGLDTFRLAQQTQRTTTAWQALPLRQKSR